MENVGITKMEHCTVNVNDSAGPSIDREKWSQLMDSCGDNLNHRLWVSVIREVATATVEHKLNTHTSPVGVATNVSQNDPEILQEELINTWLDDALPVSDDLGFMIGELDYFREMDMSWEDKISLSGNACDYSSDLIYDLNDRYDCFPGTKDAVVEAAVDCFYIFWRTRFLNEVLKAAQSLE